MEKKKTSRPAWIWLLIYSPIAIYFLTKYLIVGRENLDRMGNIYLFGTCLALSFAANWYAKRYDEDRAVDGEQD